MTAKSQNSFEEAGERDAGGADQAVARRPAARATSYDVARLAGVSQSAVSRAFRDGGSISREKRAKVEKAARALGYAPSQIARSLITQRSRMMGVVMTELTARNYPDVLRFLGREIQETGNRMLFCSTPDDGGAPAAIVDLLAFHVDGIISTASLPPESLEACERQGVPVALYNRAPRSASVSAVACDHAMATDLLVEHLVAGGLRDAVFIAGPERAPVSNDRMLGVRDAFAVRGLALRAVLHSDYSYEGGREMVTRRLAGAERPDTIVCANDAMALGVMDACRFELNLRIPDDIAVAGFDDVAQAAWPSYDLTTVRQPVRRMTQAAVRMLTERIAGMSAGGERRLLPAELRPRGSTRRPAASQA